MSNGVSNDVKDHPAGHSPGHARHDRLVVVRSAAGDADAREVTEARALVASCPDCARLAADISQLRTSMAALPTPRRTRNFRLTQEQADQLRGSALERFLRRLAVPQLALLRPIAGVAFALGLTITVVGAGLPNAVLPVSGVTTDQGTSAPVAAPSPVATQELGAQQPTGSSQQPGGARETVATPGGAGATYSSAPVPVFATTTDTAAATAAGGAKSPSPSGVEASPPPAPTTTTTFTAVLPQSTSAAPTAIAPPAPTSNTPPPERSDPLRLLLIYGGVTLAMVAFAVLLLSVYARRRTEDPLLR